MRFIFIFCFFVIISFSSNATPQSEQIYTSSSNTATFVELYTSQGCSSCPPAEKWLSTLIDDPTLWHELIPTNFHVDYWDYLGWKDPFAKQIFSERQRLYKSVGKTRVVGTPGFVVNGAGWQGWFKGHPIPQNVAASHGRLQVNVKNQTALVQYCSSEQPTEQSQIHAALLGFGVKTDVPRGENAGRYLQHDFVVIDYKQNPLEMTEEQLFTATMTIPENRQVDTAKQALVFWVTKSDNPSPLQYAAGWYE